MEYVCQYLSAESAWLNHHYLLFLNQLQLHPKNRPEGKKVFNESTIKPKERAHEKKIHQTTFLTIIIIFIMFFFFFCLVCFQIRCYMIIVYSVFLSQNFLNMIFPFKYNDAFLRLNIEKNDI